MGGEQGNAVRWLAIGLRPIVIVAGGIVAASVLVALGPSSFGGDGSSGVLLTDRLRISLEIIAVGLVASIIVGGALGLGARSSAALDRLVGLLSVPASALAAPVVVLTLVYWLAIRSDLLPAFGWASFADDPGAHLRRLIIPTVTIVSVLSLPIASAVRDTVQPWRPRPFGHDAVAAVVANRSGPLSTRLVGVPLGALLLAMFSIELLLGIPGMFRLLLDGILRFRSDDLIPTVAVIVVGGAAVALVVDIATTLLGEREVDGPTPGTGATPTEGGGAPVAAMVAGGGLLVVLVLMGIAGRVAGRPGIGLRAGGGGLLSDGHLLGTDRLGRDLLHLVASATGGSLYSAVIPAVVATAAGLVVAVVGRAGHHKTSTATPTSERSPGPPAR
ncbi:MAG: hypothetical protein AAFN30_02670, partial [Actinomycetota bacterium]